MSVCKQTWPECVYRLAHVALGSPKKHYSAHLSALLPPACRIFYSFDQLRLSVAGLQLPLPVFFKGGGWTDCVLLLLDAEGGGGLLRVMENSRRDTLVLVQRH